MPATIGANLLKYLGLVGTSGVHTGSLVPRSDLPGSNERLFREFDATGDVADPDIWSRYNSAMRRPATFDSMLQLWDEMSEWDLMKAALVEVVDEATQVDANSPATIWYQCNDREFEEELNNMLLRVNAEEIAQSQVWNIAALGNHFEKIEYAPNEGVMGLAYVHPADMRRYWLERNRKCIGFKWQGHKPDREDIYVMPDNQTPVERVAIGHGKDVEDLWYPWDFLHFRRMFRLRFSEHGEPIFDEAQGIYKKLRIAIDQMVVHRAQVQPDRYSINIDVQEQPPIEQLKTVQRWKQALRSKLAFGNAGNQGSLNAPSDFASYYNSLALDTILYIAQPKGFQHGITKIPGTAQVPDVYDIELLTDLFFSIIGMPRSWLGGSKDQQNAPSGKALLAQDIRFLRKIKSIRRPMTQAYTWLGYFHAVLKGKNVMELDIKAMMPPIGGLEDQMKLEMLEMQTNVLSNLADVMEKYRLPKEAWIETIFKRYLHLPDDVLNVFITSLPVPVEGADAMQGENQFRKSAPYSHKLIQEVERHLQDNPRTKLLVEQLKTCSGYWDEGQIESARRRVAKFKKPNDVLQFQQLKENELVIQSMERHPVELRQMDGAKPLKKSLMPLTEHLNARMKGREPAPDAAPAEPAYRKFMPAKF